MTQAAGITTTTYVVPLTGAAAIPWRYLTGADHVAQFEDAGGVPVGAPLAYGSGFTVAPAGNTLEGAGVLTLVAAIPTGAAHLRLTRETDDVQLYDAPDFNAGVEAQLDRQTLAMQELRALVGQISNLTGAVAAALEYSTTAEGARDEVLEALAALEAVQNILPGLRQDWATATVYIRGDIVAINGGSEIALVAHTSGVFATDKSNGKWQTLASRGAAGAGTGDVLRANNGSDFANGLLTLANLGALSMALQDAGNVAITGGFVRGIDPMDIADGGTGAFDPAGAQAGLEVPPRTRTITGTGLATGGGDLQANREINVRKATEAEAIAGTDDESAMTPLTTKAAIDAAGGGAITAGDVVVAYLSPPGQAITVLAISVGGSNNGTLQKNFFPEFGCHTMRRSGTIRIKATLSGQGGRAFVIYKNGAIVSSQTVATISVDLAVVAGDTISFGGSMSYSFGSNGGTANMIVTAVRICGDAAKPWRY